MSEAQRADGQGAERRLERGVEMITRILELAGLDLQVEKVTDGASGRILLRGEDSWAISGRHEETITALQHLVSRALSEPGEDQVPSVESADRDSGRDERLAGLAAGLAALARQVGKTVAVDLMTQADRKALHQALVGEAGLESFSAGNGAYRRLVVRPQRGGPNDNSKR